MASDKSEKHKNGKILHHDPGTAAGLKRKTFSKLAGAKKLAKKMARKNGEEPEDRMFGEPSGKKAKKLITKKSVVGHGKVKTGKKVGNSSLDKASLANWEPAFRILTGQYYLDFIG